MEKASNASLWQLRLLWGLTVSGHILRELNRSAATSRALGQGSLCALPHRRDESRKLNVNSIQKLTAFYVDAREVRHR